MTEKEYRSAEGINKSALWEMQKSPAHFKYLLDNPKEAMPAMVIGRAFHKLVLEPDGFDDEFIVLPNDNLASKAGCDDMLMYLAAKVQAEINLSDKVPDKQKRIKEILAALSFKGIDVLSEEEMSQIENMANSVFESPLAMSLISGEHELPIFWDDAESGELCKGKCDAVSELQGKTIVSDLKSCLDASTDKFTRDALNYGYDVQAAHYCNGIDALRGCNSTFVFIAVEKNPPYALNIIAADDNFMTYGQQRLKRLMCKYHECKEADVWPGYLGENPVISETIVPGWILKEIENNG